MPQNSSIPSNFKLAEKMLIPQDLRTQITEQTTTTTEGITWFPENWTIQKKLAEFLKDTKDLPFWIHQTKPELHKQILKSTKRTHPYKRPLCCFNHYIGLPKKEGVPKPIFDYELDIYNKLEKEDNIIIVKARGLGITEFFLRYFVWKSVTNDDWFNRTGALITGIRQDTATELIRRIRGFFLPFGIFFDSREDTINIRGTRFKAFPAYNVDSLRSYTDFCFIFCDEAGFFPNKQQTLLREAVEGYRLKSKPKIIWNSTAGEVFGDVMDQIQDEIKKGTSPFKLIELPYTVGLGKIYDTQLIETEKSQPYFPREYELKKGYGVGNILNEYQIQQCMDTEYDVDRIVAMSPKVIGIDPGFGSSKFAICVSQFVDGRIQILYANEFDRPEPTTMERLTLDLTRDYNLFSMGQQQNGQVIIDGANISFIKYLKTMLGEYTQYEELDPDDYKYMKVRPVNFGTHHRHLMTNMLSLVSKGYVSIDPRFEELISQMRTAQMDDSFGLIKKVQSFDLIDAFRLNLWGYELI